jgi:hypothetical protein
VPYTVWCNDRLVGESDLDYIANTDEHMMGDFVATEFGEELIPILMAPRKAMMAREPMASVESLFERRQGIPLVLRDPAGAVMPAELIEITDTEWLLSLAPDIEDDWQADLALAEAELREELAPSDDDGSEQISADPPPWIDDEDEDLDEFDVPDVELADDGPPREFPRYQLQVLFSLDLAGEDLPEHGGVEVRP